MNRIDLPRPSVGLLFFQSLNAIFAHKDFSVLPDWQLLMCISVSLGRM